MELTNYGYIILAPGYDSNGQKSVLESDQFKSTIYAVPDLDSGCRIAQKMVSDGVQVIELCGGFEDEGLNRIIESIEGKVPVGHATFKPQEEKKLKDFLES